MASKKRVFTCIVPSCKQSSSKSELKFFKFPIDPKRRTQWISSIGLSEASFINKHNFVCQRHFKPENIGNHYLTKNAVPSLNLINDVENNFFSEVPTNNLNSEAQNVDDINILRNTSDIMISATTQTEPIDEEVEFLKIINKINCLHCNRVDSESVYCDNCNKTRKMCFLYKTKLVLADKKYKTLRTKFRKLQRNFNILRKKHTQIKNITTDGVIDKSAANEMTKNVCKLLLKEDYFYTENDRKFAQCLYYKSATTYKYLKNTLELRLPSVSSIYKWSPIRFILPGINHILLSELKHLFDSMPVSSRLCVLTFDEITIRKDLTVNPITDRVEGYCDTGTERSNKIATSALFFMLRGLLGSWKHVLSYVLINNSINVHQLSELIINNIKVCQEVLKLEIVMITCDQATTNVAVYKHLGVGPEKPYILLNEKKIFLQFDPPHLIKSARNALLKNQFIHSEYGTTDFNVVRKVYDFDKNQKVRLLPRLTNHHMDPNNFQKMSVKLAVQVLSKTVSCALQTTLKTTPSVFDIYLQNVLPTAKVIEQFNNIFDCLNCRSFSSKNTYEQPLKINGKTHGYLQQSLQFLNNLKISSKNENYFKFIKGFQLTITAQLELIKYLNSNYNIKYILTGKTNQDALENFFSALRGKGGYNCMPSSYEIGVHFANIVVTKIIFNSMHANCLPDDAESLKLNWKTFKADYDASLKQSDTDESNLALEIDNFIEKAEFSLFTSNAISYYAGYCAFKKIQCENCKIKLLKSDCHINANDTFINEIFFKKHNFNFGSLNAPSDEWFEISKCLIQVHI